MRNEVAEKGQYLCPICNAMVDCKGNISLFNRHVDKCLTKDQSEANNPNPNMELEGNDLLEVKSAPAKSGKKVQGRKGKGTGTLTAFLKK